MKMLNRLTLARAKLHQRREIRRLAWSGAYVGDYKTAPTWAYTIGFDETLDHPELVVFDVQRKAASRLFAHAFQEIRTGKLTIEDGLVWPPGEANPYVWRKVHPDHVGEWLTLACMRRYDRTGRRYGLEAFQFVLPDNEGLLPWEDGYDQRLRPLQRALYEPPASEANA